ncbi:hypothetical protein [Macrococcus caseolyticus]|uniref:hypothetical protein n=1 Tax=Macrococcoides caseolyticum TaxID=69966 RepID=UPI0018E2B85C
MYVTSYSPKASDTEKNDKRYPGTPDIYNPKYKTAVFVNSCFWHVHTVTCLL